ncbi:MAG: imidazole glycerol phosphate synthase subunit HisH [Nitrospinota bacterium]
MGEKNITIVDYGMGNVWSVFSALKFLGAKPKLVSDAEKISKSGILVLPGVGSFKKGMEALKSRGLDEALIDAVKTKGSRILGICLGMQLMGSVGTEGGETLGLGFFPNRIERFTPQELGENKAPHVGFNPVRFNERNGLFNELSLESDFYFTHSYRMLPEKIVGRYGTCFYGINFLAAFELDNICGTQFHPEKSQTNGLILLRNFLMA